MEKGFEMWVETMISRIEIIDRKIRESGKLSEESKRLLIDRGIQPFGLWTPESENKNGSTKKPTLTEIASEFGLTVDGNLLRIPRSGLSKEQFTTVAKKLESIGYDYKKGKSVFGPKWNGGDI